MALSSQPKKLYLARTLPPAARPRANSKEVFAVLTSPELSRKLEQLATADLYFARGESILEERRKFIEQTTQNR